MNKIEQTIEFYLKKHNLLNEKIIVAFSGGYDSMCLLNACNQLKFDIVAAHLNHNWRGNESLDDANYCRKFCIEHNIEFYTETLSYDIAHTETAARNARYEFFERCAQKYKSRCVLTAHNADDNAETVLYRIVKGTGTYGLEGIKEHRGIFYRPLLSVYRHDIEKYCKENNLVPCIDSSNSDTKYNRNFIRHEILPLLSKINKDAKFAINSLSEIAREESNMIEELLPETIKTQEFLSYSKGLQSRIIHRQLVSLNIDYSREKIENIRDFILENAESKSGKTISIAADTWIFVNDKEIKPVGASTTQECSVLITECGEYRIKDYTFEIKEFHDTPSTFPADDELCAYVDLSGFEFPLTLRTRKAGDFIQPLGVDGRQKLKKYLNNKKVAKYKKSELVFLCSGSQILWAPSLGISEKIKISNQPTHVIKMIKGR